jgi:hypothetical protein
LINFIFTFTLQRLKNWTKFDWALVHGSPRLLCGPLVVKGLIGLTGTRVHQERLEKFLHRVKLTVQSITMPRQSGDDASVSSSSECGSNDERSSKTGSCGFMGDQQHLRDEANAEKEKVEQLIELESKKVALRRNLLALMLVSTAAMVTYFSYKLLQKEYQRNFNIGISFITKS